MGKQEYIEREAALQELCVRSKATFSHTGKPILAVNYVEAIESVPAADVRPVVKATWKRIDYKPCGHDYECSSCGWKNDMVTHFCPNCGADMRGETDV